MDIKNKLFPYPVLCTFNDDFVESKFEANISKSQTFKELIFDYNITLENDEINEMIQNDLAEFVFHIECPYTSYRTIKKTKDLTGTFKVYLEEVKENVTINSFIIAKQDISKYFNSKFNDDYDGFSFHLAKGNIIAIDDPYKVNIPKQDENLGRIESIFSISRRAADDDSEIKIELNSDKINLLLNKDDFNSYNKIVSNPSFVPTLQSVLIFPALIYTFETLKNDDNETYCDYQWFISMSKTFKKNGSVLNKELLESKTSFELAQEVLNSPVRRAFQDILNLNCDEEDDI